MPNGTTFNQRDIILIPFPYSDMSTTKRRPVVILSNKDHNLNNEDFICCAITSNERNYKNSIEIKPEHLESGRLLEGSRVKPNKIVSLAKKLSLKKIAKLNITKSKEVVSKLNIFIKIDE